MRIDPKGTVAGWPALLVRRTLRQLRTRLQWGLSELESAAGVEAGEGRLLIRALLAEGLIEGASRNAWKVTQAVQTLSSATAAKRVTRATAQKALQQFLARVEQVNSALRAKIDETVLPVVITEQGENRNQCEEPRYIFGFSHGFACR